jgi:hypothetical protein
MAAELIIAICILLFTGTMYYQTTQFVYNDSIVSVGPDYWPQLILGGMLILGVILLVDVIKRKGKMKGKEEEAPKPYPQNLYIVLGLALVYTFAMNYLGFAISTLLLMIALMWVLKVRKIKTIMLTSVLTTTFMVVLFPKIMMVPMPRGTGIFRVISLLFY